MALDLSQVDLSVKFKDFKIKNPIIAASGTFGYSGEFDEFMDVTDLGAVVTKAITLKPREGNDNIRIFETYGGMINSIGLENVGIERFIAEKLPVLIENDIEFIVNLAGSTSQEYIELAKICEENSIKAVELNISCPNVKSGCLEFGVDEDSLYELVNSVRQEFMGCLIVKLTPNVTSIEKMGFAAQKAGANVISAINTLKGLGLKLDFSQCKFQKKMLQGGLSGRAIKPVALGAVYRLSKAVDIPIIGMGGICSFEDVLEFLAVGADAVQIGTANFTCPDLSGNIVNQLAKFMADNGFKNLDEIKYELRGIINEQ
jgi:dihydroorotate dehydrogenase (NAD+) catalytic subunit